MKFISVLFAVLAIVGLGQAYKLQDFENDSRDEENQSIMDLVYDVFGISEESFEELAREPTKVEREFIDFTALIPMQESIEIVKLYFARDSKVREGIMFPRTTYFHQMLREVEALKQHQDLVVFLQKAGVNVIQNIKDFHKAIGMEDYVPPNLEIENESEIEMQKVGDGMKGMFKDLEAILPKNKIQTLYQNKMANRPVFIEFVGKVTSPKFHTLVSNLRMQTAFQTIITQSANRGLEFAAMEEYARQVMPIPSPKVFEV